MQCGISIMQQQVNEKDLDQIVTKLTDSVFLADLLIGTEQESKLFNEDNLQDANELLREAFKRASEVISDY